MNVIDRLAKNWGERMKKDDEKTDEMCKAIGTDRYFVGGQIAVWLCIGIAVTSFGAFMGLELHAGCWSMMSAVMFVGISIMGYSAIWIPYSIYAKFKKVQAKKAT